MPHRSLLCSLLVLACSACASAPARAPAKTPAPTAVQIPPDEPRTVVPPLLPEAREPMPGVTTGGQPSMQQLAAAKQNGIRTVISLLPEAETQAEAAEAQRLGLRFVSIPVPDASAITKENAQRLAAAMDPPEAKPLLLHCASGNRVGALLALRAYYVDHASREAALSLGESAGLTSLRAVVEQQLQIAP